MRSRFAAAMLAAAGLAVDDSLSQSDAFVAFLLANGHFLLEVLLFGAIVFLLLQRSYKPDKKPLTERVRTRELSRELRCKHARPAASARNRRAPRPALRTPFACVD